MKGIAAACLLAFALLVAAAPHAAAAASASPGVNATPYSSGSQMGYRIDNIYTWGNATMSIGNVGFVVLQNYITPNQSGITINGTHYYLGVLQPQRLAGTSDFYIELMQIDWVPRQHVVNYTLYRVMPPSTTTTTAPTTTTRATSIPTTAPTTTASTTTAPTTSILPTVPTTTSSSTTTVSSTTTIPLSIGSIPRTIYDVIRGAYDFLRSLLNHNVG